jgi:CheY-like chemotaxis protein
MSKVLVVDDYPDVAESLGLLLSMSGHDVRTATAGPAALALLTEFHPDVCVLDVRMPGMDGYQVAARLRRMLGPEVRVLAMTAEPEAAADPRAGVFDRVFVKSADPRELLGAVAAPGH